MVFPLAAELIYIIVAAAAATANDNDNDDGDDGDDHFFADIRTSISRPPLLTKDLSGSLTVALQEPSRSSVPDWDW